MTPLQTLVMMQAAWPGFASDDASARLWLGYIDRGGEFAPDCARLLIESRRQATSVAEWQETMRSLRQHQALEPRPAIGSGERPAGAEFVHDLVAELHDKLRAKAGTR